MRLSLARFLVLGLEFQLAADVLRTAISPSFDEIGKLAAIAAIRTLLNYFLNREIAQELHLGINTVKWYLKSLFNTLGVSDRRACVMEARRRHLLPSK